MSEGRTIAKNASWLLFATTAQKLLAFIAFTIAARIVGPQVTGEYFFAVAVTSTFVVIGDLGLTPVVIRAIAAGEEHGRRFLGAALWLKLFLIPLAVIAAFFFVLFRDVSDVIFYTTLIMMLVMTADSIHLLYYGVLRGKQQLKFEAMGMFIGQVLTTIVAVSAAVLGLGAPGLAIALLVASTWNLGWAWRKSIKIDIEPHPPSKKDIRLLLWQAVPFALAGIFVKVYSYLDTLVIQAFHGEQAVGQYAVAYKVTYALQFIPLVFIAALYPALARVYADRDYKKLKEIFSGSLRLMAIVGAPIAAGLSAIAARLVDNLYGTAFAGAIMPLTILPWVLIPIFLDFPVGSLLNATHRAHLKTTAMGGAMVVNAILNVMLVPSLGPVGAAWSAVASFWFLLLVGILFVWKELPSPWWFVSLLTRSIGVAAIIWFTVRFVGSQLPFIFMILFGAAAGIIALMAVRLLSQEDIRIMWQWLHTRVRPLSSIQEQLHDK